MVRSYNEWLDDDWGYDRDGRIQTAPLLCLGDPAAAEAELARLVERGARLVVLRPAPVVSASGMRSLGDPTHDRVWALAAEAGVVVAFHAADSGYGRYAADWGERATFEGVKSSAFDEILSIHIQRPIFDTMAAMVSHGVFDRHPALRVATVELGAGWVPYLFERMAEAYGKSPQSFEADPLDTFREHVWVTPFYEDAIARLHRPSRRGPRADGVRLAASRGAADARRVRRRRGGVARRYPPPDPAGQPPRVGRPGCLGPVTDRLATDLDAFRAAFAAWLDEHDDVLARQRAVHSNDFAEIVVAQRPLQVALFDAGWVRYGWPEHLGGLGGDARHRGSMYEALAARLVPLPESYYTLETLIPMLSVYAPELARAAPRRVAARRRDLVPGVLRARRGKRPCVVAHQGGA